MDLFEEIVRMRKAGERGALATIVHTNGSIPSYESSRMLVREDGTMAGTIGGGCVEAEVWAAAKDVIRVEQPRKMTFNLNHEAAYDAGLICGGTLEIFVEPILPQPTLYIFGGGHVSSAVAQAAAAAGFNIAIADDREAFANAERFPMASEIYATYEDAFEKIKPTASSYLLIVTRGHKDDMRVLAWAVRTEARYIGMIGSKRKVISVYQALEKKVTRLRSSSAFTHPLGSISARSRQRKLPSASQRNSSPCAATQKTCRTSPSNCLTPQRPSTANSMTIDAAVRQRPLVAVILAAGESRRMGTPKALLPYRGKTFIEHLLEITRQPRIAARRIVLGAHLDQIRAKLPGEAASIVVNPDWRQGQLSSIQAAIRTVAADETAGLVLCPVDHPLFSPKLIAQLIDAFDSTGQLIVLPVYHGRRGHPVIFAASLYPELLAASPAIGAREVVWAHATELHEVPTEEEGVVLNINDPETLRRALENREAQP